MPSIQTSLAIVVSIEYDQIFNQPRPDWNDLFAGIPTTTIIELIGYCNATIYLNEIDQAKQYKLINWLLSRQSEELKSSFIRRISEINSNGNSFSFFSNQSSCVLIEKALEHFIPGKARDLSIEEEERFIKAYLLATQEWVDEDLIVFKGIKDFTDPKHIVEFALPHFLPFHDLKKFRDFRWQIFKAIEFFNYIEQHEILSDYLQAFSHKYSLATWKQYITQILNCFLSVYRSEEGENTSILRTLEGDPIINFLDSLSITNLETYEKKIDFIGLREKPVLKSDIDSYVLYNYSFFVDKLFQTVIFDFGIVLIENEIVKSIPDFKSKYYSEAFYEQYFLYRLIRYMIGKRQKCVAFDGLEWEIKYGQKGPDFYIRCGSKIFVIEFKDAIFQANAKISRDYEMIKNELFIKLRENKKGKQKGVTQLAITCNEISEKGLSFDTFKKNEVQIFPILIITDEAFNSYGINYVLNTEYQNLLNEEAKFVSKELIVIHIDTLIEMQDIVHDRQVPIQDCFQWYFDYINNSAHPHNRFLSFSNFIIQELALRGYKLGSLPRYFNSKFPKVITF